MENLPLRSLNRTTARARRKRAAPSTAMHGGVGCAVDKNHGTYTVTTASCFAHPNRGFPKGQIDSNSCPSVVLLQRHRA